MLTRSEHPVAWAKLMYKLADAREHLGDLNNLMAAGDAIDNSDFEVRLDQVFAHLSRA